MTASKWYLSRRAVLRGVGAGLALPFLEAMIKPGAHAAAGNYVRFMGMYGVSCGPVGIKDRTQGGIRVAPWTPEAAGSILDLNPDRYLRYFFDRNLQSKISILTGLSDRQTRNHDSGTIMSPGSKSDNNVGPLGTADYIIHQALLARQPGLRHLVLSAAPTRGGTGGSGTFRTNISFSPTQAMPTVRNPHTAFDSVFGTNTTEQGENSAEDNVLAAKKKRHQQSILNSVREDANRLNARLGRSDQQRLDQYLTGIRELEQRLTTVELPAPGECSPGAPPNEPSSDYLQDPSKLSERLKLMMDITVKAMECGKTRVASLMFMGAYGRGYHGDYHTISHYKSDGPEILGSEQASIDFIETATEWTLEHYAYLMEQLDQRIDPDGSTMLDNSILYISTDHSDAHFHSAGSMPIILGGRGGKTSSGTWAINAGRHVRYPPFEGSKEVLPPAGEAPGNERSVRDLLWGIVNHFGPELASFGVAKSPTYLDWSDAMAS